METVEGVMVALYKEVNGFYRYAVLKRVRNWKGWELVKGHIDNGEAPKEAARREVREETGVTPLKVERLDGSTDWTYERGGKKYYSDYKLFMARAPSDGFVETCSNQDSEHSKGFFLNYRDVREILEFENQVELLDKVNEKLEK